MTGLAALVILSAGAYHNALELQQGWAWTEGDPFMDRSGPTWAVHYYLRDALAIGVRGMAYTRNSDTDFAFGNRRATRVPMPLDEYQWQAELTVTYAFLHGGRSLLHFDAYALAGAGVLSARPVPVFDPDNRVFDFRLSSSFGGGLGLRVFITRWIAASVEVRDFAYFGHHENPAIAPDPRDPASWYGPTTLTNNVQLQLGFSLFAPVPSPR